KIREVNTLLESSNSFRNRKIREDYEIGDFSEEEIEEEEDVVEVEELGVEYFDKYPTRDEPSYDKQLEPRVDHEDLRRISNFTGRIRGMHVFVGNFTYIAHFLIVEGISSVIDPCLSQVVLGKQFVEVSNMTYDSSLGIVKFTNGVDEVAYKMPHKIEQF
ncbi:hypothetical protein Tco_0516986, partial [Tanacetum coccineum]